MLKQDACRGVHSACRREANRHKLDICVLGQGRIQEFSYVGQNFLVLKWKEIQWRRQLDKWGFKRN